MSEVPRDHEEFVGSSGTMYAADPRENNADDGKTLRGTAVGSTLTRLTHDQTLATRRTLKRKQEPDGLGAKAS